MMFAEPLPAFFVSKLIHFNVHLFTQALWKWEERNYGTLKAVRSPLDISCSESFDNVQAFHGTDFEGGY